MGTVIFNKEDVLCGWLGNRMFQVAATMGIALRNHMDYVFPPSEYYEYFSGKIPVAADLHLRETLNYEEPAFHYTAVKLDPHHNHNLHGYFQSERYWLNCEDLVRKTFRFRAEEALRCTMSNGLMNVSTIQGRDVVPVSIHVRRGDYLNYPSYHPVLGMDYYNACMLKMRQLLPGKFLYYYVFSDDRDWCNRQFAWHINEGKAEVFRGSAAEDMCMMSLCAHHIIANSSFSWWGSYLNNNPDKIVLAPAKEKWFGKAYGNYNLDDLYMKNWILVG